MRLALTGTPGTGKTSVSELLAPELKLELIHLNEFAISKGFVLGHDEQRDSIILDTDRLRLYDWSENCLIEGHLSHLLGLDTVIVLRTHPSELKKRLEKKGWAKEKISENLEAEALGIIASEAPGSFQIDTTKKSLEQVVDEIKAVLSGKLEAQEYDFIDWF